MLSSDSQQGIYAPLSQVMSDSDSEEEIHNSSRHTSRRQQQPQQNQQQQQYHQTNHNNLQQQQQRQSRQRNSQRHQQQGFHTRTNLQYHQKYPNGHQMHHSSSMSLQNSFRSVMDGGSNFTSFNSDGEERHQTDADNVAILGPPETKDEPMTTTRKCCFIGSILLCVLTVVIFLWVIPCSEEGTCPAPPDRIKTHNWLNNYTKIELKGVINVVDGLRNWEKNLIFLYRGDAFFPEFEPSNTKRNGIISLIGSSGAIAWFDEMVDEPITIDCTLIDIDKNGKPDCLVIDEFGELGVINPISGQWHWKFRVRSLTKVDVLDFPVILPDLDGDGIYEILLATTSPILDMKPRNFITPHIDFHGDAPSGARNLLRIISGRIGKPIGDGYKVHECDVLRKFQLEKNHIITFNCVRNSTEAQRSKALTELFSLVTNRSIKSEKLTPALKISQHRHYGQRKETEAQRNIYSLSGRELIVENRGKCPDDCNVSFILSEERNGRVNVVRNFTNPGMYGMVPAQWHFKNSKSKMSGFVMKFWKWNNDSTLHSHRKKREEDKDESDFPTSEFNIFDHLVQKRHTYTIPEKIARVERSTANITRKKTSSSLLLNSYKRQMITETVVLVIFIGSDTRIENTSQSDIIQFCRNEGNEVVCQPDLNNQENSLLIADLDQDGSQELVSYYSTFKEDDQTKDWKLVTYVQLLRLESELPGFYGEGKRN
ncbi:uncharacterized protein LOC129910728 [Episyrphus balteatus]|uniref:uncharacterized protein LOC129910728 n=1 Tax=Episyrphus balteatus TaxID=286459 RepID=UPI0024861F00|nr:uncharacterized protein LOC129910728 [Episyrphus balteatus]